ncbi:MAG TPA: glycosyltransferase family 4 protein [Chloroflexi bacterium]|nr:glycosyltransferase family 4 protein [Chloroflexota bacterium]
MKLAIVCSWLNQYGGAERVLEVIHDMYPEAPIYTSIYAPEALPERYRDWDIRPSFLNRLPLIRRRPQPYLPLYPLGFESLDLRGYDVILSLTSAFAHGVITSAETQHVCYCLTPARFLWNYYAYIEREGVGRLARTALLPFLKSLRQWDHAAAERVDRFIAISRTVQRRIDKYYRRPSDIIYPPVDTDYEVCQDPPGDYYLVVSRLVPYKRIDLAVRAFNELGLPLKIVGEGRDRAALQAIAGPNIEFLGYVSDEEKRDLMAHCRAFLFPGEEDFGLTPLEAMAMGRPAIAYAAGGALDTLEEGRTGVYFREATPESLADAVRRLEKLTFDPHELHRHAQTFGVPRFRQELAAALEQAYATARGER